MTRGRVSMTRSRWPQGHFAVWSVACAKCNAPKGRPCVYTKKRARGNIGDYVCRPHTVRVHKWRSLNERANEARATLTRARVKKIYTEKADRENIMVAHYRFDRQEEDAVRAWLRQYGSILWKPPQERL
jgi:hypothetical protein